MAKEAQEGQNPRIAELEEQVTSLTSSLAACKEDISMSESQLNEQMVTNQSLMDAQGKLVAAARAVLKAAKKHSAGSAFAEVSVDALDALQAAL